MSQLLSKNPLKAFEEIKNNYILYLKTAYHTRFEELNDKLDELWNEEGNLYKNPYIEALPQYKNYGQTFKNLPKEIFNTTDDRTAELIKKFIGAGLFAESYTPYSHQVEMLKEALSGNNCVITSGTGSGKTEAFLMPLISQILKEASGWKAPNPINDNQLNAWNEKKRMPHRKHEINDGESETRPAAIRALILYPMNALVEDQLARLREALDSDEVRNICKSELENNRIYFGRYTGNTPGGGEENKSKISLAQKELQNYHSATENLFILKNREDIQNTQNEDAESIKKAVEDAEYLFPRMPILNGEKTRKEISSEILLRWDMQEMPPDILITNFSMLSIMLMRKQEESMLEKTRAWLSCEDIEGNVQKEHEKTNRIFHLVVDELHLYRGTAGSELAYLIRLFLHRLGLLPTIEKNGKKVPNPQLRILASSASLGNSETDSNTFLREFFGVESDDINNPAFKIISGKDEIEPNRIKKDLKEYKNKFIELSELNEDELKLEFPKIQIPLLSDILWSVFIDDDENRYRPKSSKEVYTKLFGEDESPSKKAFEGLLKLRGVDKDDILKLPRMRFHYFFKYMEGVWATPSLENQSKIGEISPIPQLKIGENRALELLRCEQCGTTFFGGNKKLIEKNERNKSWQLSIDSPNLEIIPNKNPIQMVQNKTHDEYAVFWPFEEIPEHSLDNNKSEDFVGLGIDLTFPNIVKSFRQVGIKEISEFSIKGPLKGNPKKTRPGVWQKASLNPNSGLLALGHHDNQIKGFVFRVFQSYDSNPLDAIHINQEYNHSALPQCCPSCNTNFSYRKYVKSPIRSYRTGISKSNQILLKSFFHQLIHDDRKLISFSDSREDAAQFAYKTEQEHHRNTISDILLDIIYKESSEKGDKIEMYKKLIGQYDATKRIPKQEEFKGFTAEEIKEFRDWLRILKDEDAEIIEKDSANAFLDEKRNYVVDAIKLENLFPSSNSIGLLIDELLQKGMNPSGVGKNKDYIDGKYWSQYFDFENKNFIKNISDSVRTHFIENIEADICDNLFSKLWFSFENAGIGIVKMMPDNELRKKLKNENIPDQRIEDYLHLTNAFIRVLGENFRFKNPDSSIELKEINDGNFTGKIRRWVEKAESSYLQMQTIKKIIASKHPGFIINPSELYFEPIKNPEESNVYECLKCKQTHLHSAGNICTFCNHAGTSEVAFYNIKETTVKSLQKSNFIAQRLLSNDFTAHRMRLGELSGQTDNQPQRIMEFKGAILPKTYDNLQNIINNKKVQEIDVISVTTTMEVGVDIGSLQAVYQANMPPARYNYQQRVGRGGRRGQAYSAVLTFCRGKSHDNYYFNYGLDEMTGAIPVPPTLSVKEENKEILRRIIVKGILQKAFNNKNIYPNLDKIPNDTHGEFGSASKWLNNKNAITDWVQNNEEVIMGIIEGCTLGLYFDIKTELIDWIQKELIGFIDKAVEKSNDEGLAETLANEGLLPLFGMPSVVRNFYHGVEGEDLQSIDRPIEMAISEFAPGSIKTKDKAEYEVAGITVPLKYQNHQGIIPFNKDNANPLKHSYSLENYESTSNIKDSILIIPLAFRTLKLNNVAQEPDNRDSNTSFSKLTTVALPQPSKAEQKRNVNITFSESTTFGNPPIVWKINDNKSNYFTLYENIEKGNLKSYLKDTVQENLIKVALGAKKITDILGISVDEVPDGINLKITGNIFRDTAIKASHYSAAFILQRVLASELDIDPTEIEIPEIKEKDGLLQIILCDTLPNGSGFIRYLKDNFEAILKKIIEKDSKFVKAITSIEHYNTCKSSCPKCLNSYFNQDYHHILDWRLGLDLIHLMYDSTYDCGLSDKNNLVEYLFFEDTKIVLKTIEQLNCDVINDYEIGTYSFTKQIGSNTDKHIVKCLVSHPFWDEGSIPSSSWLESIIKNESYEFVDLFNLQRRANEVHNSLK